LLLAVKCEGPAFGRASSAFYIYFIKVRVTKLPFWVRLFFGLSDLFCVSCRLLVLDGGLTSEFAGVFAGEGVQVIDLGALKNETEQRQ
jgi:hypothetical protein